MSQPLAGNTVHTQPSNATHYPALDGLRAVAFSLVLLTHYYRMPWGFGGVNLFFVLSGFLITGILYDTRDRPDRARRFYIRRSLRIFPLYFAVIAGVVLCAPFLRWVWSWPWLAWPLYLGNFLRFWGHGGTSAALRALCYGQLHSTVHPTVLLYFGHFWSLCVEEQFYLIWPWVVFGVRSRRLLFMICVAAVVCCPVARSLAEHVFPVWAVNRELSVVVGVPFQLDALLLGGLLALTWRSAYRRHLQRVASLTLLVMTVCGLGYLVHVLRMYPWGHVRDLYQYPDWRTTWDLSVLDLYGAALLICALRPGSVTYQCLNRRGLRYLGRISYGAYVFHDIPHQILVERVERIRVHLHLGREVTEPMTLGVALIFTVVAASISYRWIETPFLNLKERWARERLSRTASLAEATAAP